MVLVSYRAHYDSTLPPTKFFFFFYNVLQLFSKDVHLVRVNFLKKFKNNEISTPLFRFFFLRENSIYSNLYWLFNLFLMVQKK